MKISPKMKQFAWKVLSDEDFSDFEKEVKLKKQKEASNRIKNLVESVQ